MSFKGDFISANILVDGANYSFVGGGQIRNSGPVIEETRVNVIDTAGDESYSAAQILGGLILRDPNGAGRSDSVPSAADLVDAINNCRGGDSFTFAVRNTADAAETITVSTSTGATLDGTMTVAQNETRLFVAVIDDASEGNEAYTVYSLGNLTH